MLPMNDDFLKDVKLYVGVCAASDDICRDLRADRRVGCLPQTTRLRQAVEVKGMQLLPEVPIIRPFER